METPFREVPPAIGFLPMKHRRRPTLQKLLEIVSRVPAGENVSRVLRDILASMVSFTGAQRGAIFVFRKAKGQIQVLTQRRGATFGQAEKVRLEKAVRRMRRTGQGGWVPNSPVPILCHPLQTRSGILGAVCLEGAEGSRRFPAADIALIGLLSHHVGLAIETTALRRQAGRDHLTGLSNHRRFRRRLGEELRRAGRSGYPCGVLMMDLDDFKKVNESFGHLAGNKLIAEFSLVLRRTVRDEDLVGRHWPAPEIGRFGGDEFEVLLPGADRQGVRKVGKRILSAIRRIRVRSGRRAIRIHASAGGAVFPDNGTDPRTLLDCADAALYASKERGKDRLTLAGR